MNVGISFYYREYQPIVPEPPASISLSSSLDLVNNNVVTVTWPAARWASYYKVYVGTSSGVYTTIYTTSSLSYSFKKPLATYYVTVSALNFAGESSIGDNEEHITLTSPSSFGFEENTVPYSYTSFKYSSFSTYKGIAFVLDDNSPWLGYIFNTITFTHNDPPPTSNQYTGIKTDKDASVVAKIYNSKTTISSDHIIAYSPNTTITPENTWTSLTLSLNTDVTLSSDYIISIEAGYYIHDHYISIGYFRSISSGIAVVSDASIAVTPYFLSNTYTLSPGANNYRMTFSYVS